MSFNAFICKVVTICRSRNPITYDYCMNGMKLEHEGNYEDFLVIIDSILSFTSQIQCIGNKSKRMWGLIKKFQFRTPMSVKLQLFLSLVPNNLEYGSQL